MNQAFSKIWIVGIAIVLLVGGILAWQFWLKKVPIPKIEMPESVEETKKQTVREERHYLIVRKNIKKGGRIISDIMNMTCDINCEFFTGNYRSGHIATIKVIPAEGYNFVGWSGDCLETSSNTCKILIDKDKEIIANFKPILPK